MWRGLSLIPDQRGRVLLGSLGVVREESQSLDQRAEKLSSFPHFEFEKTESVQKQLVDFYKRIRGRSKEEKDRSYPECRRADYLMGQRYDPETKQLTLDPQLYVVKMHRVQGVKAYLRYGVETFLDGFFHRLSKLPSDDCTSRDSSLDSQTLMYKALHMIGRNRDFTVDPLPMQQPDGENEAEEQSQTKMTSAVYLCSQLLPYEHAERAKSYVRGLQKITTGEAYEAMKISDVQYLTSQEWGRYQKSKGRDSDELHEKHLESLSSLLSRRGPVTAAAEWSNALNEYQGIHTGLVGANTACSAYNERLREVLYQHLRLGTRESRDGNTTHSVLLMARPIREDFTPLETKLIRTLLQKDLAIRELVDLLVQRCSLLSEIFEINNERRAGRCIMFRAHSN